MQVTVDAQKNKGGMSSVHGNLFKLDPVMQQYLEVSQPYIKPRHIPSACDCASYCRVQAWCLMVDFTGLYILGIVSIFPALHGFQQMPVDDILQHLGLMVY